MSANGTGKQRATLKRMRTSRYAEWDERPSSTAPARMPLSPESPKPPPPKMFAGGQSCAERYTYYASPWAAQPQPPWFPEEGHPSCYSKTRVAEYQLLDFNPQLNTSSYVNVVFEPEEDQVALMGLRVNIADQTIYPGSFRLHNDALNMVADLWHCPKPPGFDEYGCFPGAGTVGSTEACLLAGLALKFRWRAWYAKRHGLTEHQVRAVYPNLVISTQFQACWEKMFKYMDVEPNFVTPSVDSFTLDPDEVARHINDKTIGVVCILGNHYGGQYDPVAAVGAAIDRVNAENGWCVGIHVDAASGGFIAPFQDGIPPWDFRVPQVLSISASGHKFGESCCGTGWVVWRERKNLAEFVAINVSYLGGKAESYTLNFSRPASGVYVQLYKFLRLGKEGYRMLTGNQMATAEFIRCGLKAMMHDDKPLFKILDNGSTNCLPVVTAMLHPDLSLPYDAIDLQHVLAERHWYVSGYKMQFHEPVSGDTVPLFTDMPAETTMFRIVVKSNLTRALAGDLLTSIGNSVQFLEQVGEGYAAMHQVEVKKSKSGAHITVC